MYVMVIDRGDGNLDFYKQIDFQRVMELEDYCDRELLTYYTFDAGEPVRDVYEEPELTEKDISRRLDMDWPNFASL